MKQFSLSELNRRSGEIVDAALAGPVFLSKHGRSHVVLMSAAQYAELTSDRAIVVPEDEVGTSKGIKLARLRGSKDEPETEF